MSRAGSGGLVEVLKGLRWLQLRASRNNGLARIAEAVGLGLFTIAVMFILSWLFGACVDVPEWHTVRTANLH